MVCKCALICWGAPRGVRSCRGTLTSLLTSIILLEFFDLEDLAPLVLHLKSSQMPPQLAALATAFPDELPLTWRFALGGLATYENWIKLVFRVVLVEAAACELCWLVATPICQWFFCLRNVGGKVLHRVFYFIFICEIWSFIILLHPKSKTYVKSSIFMINKWVF